MPILFFLLFYYYLLITRYYTYGGANNLVGGELALAVSIVDCVAPLLGATKIAGTYHGGPWRYSISTK